MKAEPSRLIPRKLTENRDLIGKTSNVFGLSQIALISQYGTVSLAFENACYIIHCI